MSQNLSHHARLRLAQRTIPPDAVALALARGRRAFSHGDTVVFIGRRDLPGGLNHERAGRSEGAVVVLAPDGTIKTVFQNRAFWTALKKRPAHPKGLPRCKRR